MSKAKPATDFGIPLENAFHACKETSVRLPRLAGAAMLAFSVNAGPLLQQAQAVGVPSVTKAAAISEEAIGAKMTQISRPDAGLQLNIPVRPEDAARGVVAFTFEKT